MLAAETPGGGAAAAADQLDLGIFDDMPSPVGVALEEKGIEPRRVGQRGKSRKNLDVVQLIRATKRPTLLALKELADLPLPDFARLLGCKPIEAFDRWYRVAELVTAYEEGRPTQRLALEPGAGGLPVVVFAGMAVDPRLAGGNPPVDVEFEEVQENQGLDDGEADQVSQVKSHDDAQSLAAQGVRPVQASD